ncbi:MAG: nucleoside-diphosphate sugar epimerase/dehydratase [Candidatus Aminicenantes bacterium]|nr:nucleoside-diphosphate sugar epimerase/dehydratase [Candidatus Aminicenantes bacterium]
MGKFKGSWLKRTARSLLRTTSFKRRAFFLTADVFLISFSMYASFWLRYDGKIPAVYIRNLGIYIGVALALKMSMIAVHGLYNVTWRFFGFKELLKLLQALLIGFLLMGILLFFLKPFKVFREFPRSVLLLDLNFTIVLLSILRVSKRIVREYRYRKTGLLSGHSRVLIVGAGSAGEQIVREMQDSRKSTHFPIGFIDDDEAKQGVSIHGVKVLGKRGDIPKILGGNGIDEVLIALPSGDSKDIREIVELIRKAGNGVKTKVLPGIHDVIEGKVSLTDIKDIEVDDLLGRDPVKIDYEKIRKFLNKKRVLVSGAGGSIGSELARTIAQFEPASLVLLDNDETELFYTMNKLKKAVVDMVPVVADIRDQAKIGRVFETFRPEVVLHAAAMKHVPILEHYPDEAVKTNIRGTRIMGEAAVRFGTERFVNISTDKAINPTSIMGATKRVGEEILKALNSMSGTRFISVRFGNVLGSRGSVIPLFKEQIKKGGPVTVTHVEMKRYFMAVSEAVLLVLEAAAAGHGGEAYILDMGDPVKIDDLAREMIRLSGLKPDVDIPIVYTGLRGGEKLFEELIGSEEGSEKTENEKIFRAKNSKPFEAAKLWRSVDQLIDCSLSGTCRKEAITKLLKEIVPTFKPDGEGVSIIRW